MFENFPYSNFHDLNLDWIIKKVKEAYSPDNPPDNMVLSVNGETGDVILYQSENVVFPDVTSDQWRMVRSADGHTTGVLFNQNYMYVMYDNVADRVYTMNHPPQYPVTSVDGETGAVRVFPNAASRLPDVTENYTNIRRQIRTDNTDNVVGIELTQNKAYRMKDASRYEIYDSDNPPPYPVTSVNGDTGAIVIAIPFLDIESDDILFSEQASGHTWSLGRETQDGTASIQLVTNSTKAEAYIDFYDGEGLTFTKKLLTADDIPSSSGVVSVNGSTGVVVLYGTDIALSNSDSTTVSQAISNVNAKTGADIPVSGSDSTKIDAALSSITSALNSNVASIDGLEDAIAIVANNNTHGAISAGQFVYVKNHSTLTEGLYKANTNIAANAALSSSNLVADSTGGLNALTSDIATLNSNISSLSGQIENNTFYTPTVYQSRCTIDSGGVVKIGKFVILNIIIKASTTASNSPQILTLPNSYASKIKTSLICMENDENAFGNHLGSDAVCGIHYDKIFIKSITNDNYYFINGVWIADE